MKKDPDGSDICASTGGRKHTGSRLGKRQKGRKCRNAGLAGDPEDVRVLRFFWVPMFGFGPCRTTCVAHGKTTPFQRSRCATAVLQRLGDRDIDPDVLSQMTRN